MNVRPVLIACAMLLAAGCSDPGFETSPLVVTDSGNDDAIASETSVASDAADAGSDETAIDAGSDTFSGVGLPCTNMAQCAPYGLECASQEADGCPPGGGCVRRYTCQAHAPVDAKIECITNADCPAPANFCAGLVDTDSSCRVLGFVRTKCSSGSPPLDPIATCDVWGNGPGPFSSTDTLFTCGDFTDCTTMPSDSGTARCCATTVGISYCGSDCALK